MPAQVENTSRFWSPPGFVALPENRSARLAIRRCAYRLGRMPAFPLLLIHGPAGAGKTHLLQALLEFAASRCSTRLLRAGDWPRLDDASTATELLQAELLVIEDLHHLPDWAAHELSRLLERRASRHLVTVTTSCACPSTLPWPARLQSRVQAGLNVGIAPAGSRSRRRLVMALAAQRRLPLTPAALRWLARHLPASVRRIAAALDRIEAENRGSIAPITRQRVRPVLDAPAIDIEQLIDRVARHFRVTPRNILGSSRLPGIRWPRQVAIWLASRRTGLSPDQIAQAFGKDQSTARHACRVVARRMRCDPPLKRELHALLEA